LIRKSPHKKITWKNKQINWDYCIGEERQVGTIVVSISLFTWLPIPSDKYQGKYLFDMAGKYFKITPVYLTCLVYISALPVFISSGKFCFQVDMNM
jgi:hypothetical protein